MASAERKRGSKRWWYLLFLAQFVAVLWPPFYNHLEPRLFGVPFFYWYQLAWVFISALITVVIYAATVSR